MRAVLELVSDRRARPEVSDARRALREAGGRRLGRAVAVMSSEVVGVKTGAERIWWLTVTMFALAADQFSKYWMSIRLRTGDDIDVISGLVKFSYTENPGIAFGMLNHGNVKWLLIAISVIAIVAVVYYISRTPAT